MRRVRDAQGTTWEVREAGRLTPPDGVAIGTAVTPALWLRVTATGRRARLVVAPVRSLDALGDEPLLELIASALLTDGPHDPEETPAC